MTTTHEIATHEALDLCERHSSHDDVLTHWKPESGQVPACDVCGTCENVAEYSREVGPELHHGEPVLWNVTPLWAEPDLDPVPAPKPAAKPAPKRKPVAKRERKIVKPHVEPAPTAKRKPAPKRKPAANASGLTPKQVANRALAAALVSAGKDKTGTTWATARDAVKAGKTIAQAVALA